MRYKIFSKTKKFRDALRKDIQNAKKSIYLEMYIFVDDDNKNYNFVKLLIQKAKKGIKIVLVLDAFGSKELTTQAITKMRKAGIEVHFFSDRLRRIHRKIIIIDDYITFFGGANIHQGSRNRLDLQVRLRGKRASNAFLKSFAYTYKMCGGKDRDILHHYKKGIFKKIKTFIVENLPGHRLYHINEYYKEKIIQATKSIKMTTPYFIPPRRLIALLDDAIRRGVTVEIIIPYDTDIKTLNKINYHFINKHMDLGIIFYAMSQMNHAKMLIIDDKEALIGSENIDKLSFAQNFEIGAFFKQKNMVIELVKVFNTRRKKSKLYEKMDITLSIKDRIIGMFLRLIFYFM